MGRLHLLEIEDQEWLPAVIRDGMTDYLTFIAEQSSLPFRAYAKLVHQAMRRCHTSTLVDLGTGGGGPAIGIAKELQALGRQDLRIILTDLYPNLARLQFTKKCSSLPVDVHTDSINATDVPAELAGFRLMTNIFHHLPADMARACLADAVHKNQGIGILELVSRSPNGFLQLCFAMPMLLLAMPFVRPFKLSRLFFTYIIPIIPFCTVWDGIVSCFRVYSPTELRNLVAQLPSNDYVWDIGRLPVAKTPIKLTYLVGYPRRG